MTETSPNTHQLFFSPIKEHNDLSFLLIKLTSIFCVLHLIFVARFSDIFSPLSKEKTMVSVSEFVFYVNNNVYETCIRGEFASNAQAAFEENGDNDDDDIYDYAPAA